MAKATKQKSSDTIGDVSVPSDRFSNLPLPLLELGQIANSVYLDSDRDPERDGILRRGAVEIYQAIRPTDAIESMAAAQMVALNNAVMHCFARAAVSGQALAALDVSLRHAFKGVAVFTELMKAIDDRRGLGRQNVTVGKVSVESGGQAIVGNVESRNVERPITEQATPASSNSGAQPKKFLPKNSKSRQ